MSDKRTGKIVVGGVEIPLAGWSAEPGKLIALPAGGAEPNPFVGDPVYGSPATAFPTVSSYSMKPLKLDPADFPKLSGFNAEDYTTTAMDGLVKKLRDTLMVPGHLLKPGDATAFTTNGNAYSSSEKLTLADLMETARKLGLSPEPEPLSMPDLYAFPEPKVVTPFSIFVPKMPPLSESLLLLEQMALGEELKALLAKILASTPRHRRRTTIEQVYRRRPGLQLADMMDPTRN